MSSLKSIIFFKILFMSLVSFGVETEIDNLLTKSKYSGVVLATTPYVKIHKACNPDSEANMHEGAIFPIASITKTFTSAITLLELQKRNIPLTTPVVEIIELPNFPKQVTVDDLLTHKSGLGLYTDFNIPDSRRSKHLTHQEFTKLIINSPNTPYGQFSYNNANYIVLERILEKLTGKKYKTLLQDLITTPLKMTNTGLVSKTQTSPFVMGRTKQNNEALSIDYSWLGAGAGIYSTADDLHKFALAMMEKRILSTHLLEMAWQDKAEGYGYGWTIDNIANKQIFLHEGGIDGFSTILIIEPISKSILIMLCNREIDINNLSKQMINLLIK